MSERFWQQATLIVQVIILALMVLVAQGMWELFARVARLEATVGLPATLESPATPQSPQTPSSAPQPKRGD